MLAVMAVYVDARTTVRTVYDNSKVFIVGVRELVTVMPRSE